MSGERQYGRYEVRETIGRGAMGVVYLAEDPLIGRQVAIKVVEAAAGLEADELERLHGRFEREFQTAGRLSHPNIVGVHDVGQQDGSAFIAMEYVRGQTLYALLAEGRVFSFREIVDIGTQLAGALDYAAELGVIHRDIKPGNIMITPEGRPKISDFGIAKMVSSTLTRTGTVVGTPAYMSPEQVRGQTVTGATDQFSLAVLLYQLFTGERPFQGESPTTIMYKIVHEEPLSPSALNALLPGPLDATLMRALAKNPLERYPNCSFFIGALRRVLGMPAPDLGTAAVPIEPADPRATVADLDLVPGTGATGPSGEIEFADPRPTVAGPMVIDTAAFAPTAEPSTIRPQPPAAQPSSRSAAVAMLVFTTLVAVVAAAWAWNEGLLTEQPLGGRLLDDLIDGSRPPLTTTPATVTPAAADVAQPLTRSLEVQAAEGWQIWINGVDTGASTPGTVELTGLSGESFTVSLRFGSEVLAARTFTLGGFLPLAWTPAGVGRSIPASAAAAAVSEDTAPVAGNDELPGIPGAGESATEPLATPVNFTISSVPAGAAVTLNGHLVDGVTPLELALDLAGRSTIGVRADGFDPAGWTFTGEDLSEQQRSSHVLHFPLSSSVPPGVLAIDNQYGYAVSLAITPLRQGASTQRFPAAVAREVSLPPGRYRLDVEAPSLFWQGSSVIEIEPESVETPPLPRPVSVQIAAIPGNCRVSIEGRYVGVTPFPQLLAVGAEYELTFDWTEIGQGTRTHVVRITGEGQRVIEQSGGRR